MTAQRPRAGSESMDTTVLGAITPTQVQDNNQGPTQVSHSARSQLMDTLQLPQSPVLSRRGREATGTHGVGAVDCDKCRTAREFSSIPSKQKVMQNADDEEDEFEEHDDFSSEFGERERVTAEAVGEPKFNSA